MRFFLGTVLLVLGFMIPVISYHAYWDLYEGFKKNKVALIILGSFILILVGVCLMGTPNS